MSARGRFITLEGGEGAGKGTIIDAIHGWMQERGIDHVLTREPGGTSEGQALRKALVERGQNWDPVAELLLMAADRRQHVQRVILPALERGTTVVCDRFVYSTEAYQGAGRQLPASLIAQLREITIADLQPDVVLLLDVDPSIGLARSRRRLAASGSNEDLFEGLDLDFHRRVRQSFLEQATRDPHRWMVLDASAPLQTVVSQVIEVLDRLHARSDPGS